MNRILANLADPAWWFTVTFPLIVVFVVSRLAPKVGAITKRSATKGVRRFYARSLRRIKVIRRDDLLMTKEILKESAYFTVFILLLTIGVGLFFICSVLFPVVGYGKVSVIVAVMPLYVVEMLWLIQRELVAELLTRRRKLRYAEGGM